MQPEKKPLFALLSEQEEALLSVMHELSPAQKSAFAQYLVDYTKQQMQNEQQKETQPSLK